MKRKLLILAGSFLAIFLVFLVYRFGAQSVRTVQTHQREEKYVKRAKPVIHETEGLSGVAESGEGVGLVKAVVPGALFVGDAAFLHLYAHLAPQDDETNVL